MSIKRIAVFDNLNLVLNNISKFRGDEEIAMGDFHFQTKSVILDGLLYYDEVKLTDVPFCLNGYEGVSKFDLDPKFVLNHTLLNDDSFNSIDDRLKFIENFSWESFHKGTLSKIINYNSNSTDVEHTLVAFENHLNFLSYDGLFRKEQLKDFEGNFEGFYNLQWEDSLPSPNYNTSPYEILEFKDKYRSELHKLREIHDDFKKELRFLPADVSDADFNFMVVAFKQKIENQLNAIGDALEGQNISYKKSVFGSIYKMGKDAVNILEKPISTGLKLVENGVNAKKVYFRSKLDDKIIKNNPFGYLFYSREEGLIGNYKKINDLCD